MHFSWGLCFSRFAATPMHHPYEYGQFSLWISPTHAIQMLYSVLWFHNKLNSFGLSYVLPSQPLSWISCNVLQQYHNKHLLWIVIALEQRAAWRAVQVNPLQHKPQTVRNIWVKPTNVNGNCCEMWLITLIINVPSLLAQNRKVSILIIMWRISINNYEFTRYFKWSKRNPWTYSKTQIIFNNTWLIKKQINRFRAFSCSCLMCRSFKWRGHFMEVFIFDVHKLWFCLKSFS